MDLFAIDDSAQRKPSRDGMGPLVAVGGVHVPGGRVRELELALDELCVQAGFPDGEEFKWSPKKAHWMRDGLTGDERTDFFVEALRLAGSAGACAIVVIADTEKKLASQQSSSHEEDVTMMFLERAHSELAEGEQALVIFDRQGGSQSRDTRFLQTCVAQIRLGTSYAALDRLALALSTGSKLSRLIQLADVVTSCSTSFVSGEDRYSPMVFSEGVRPLLREEQGRCGGYGLKIHPDLRYGNLYHWLLGDSEILRPHLLKELPSVSFSCYRESADIA
jgi:hypothetical protein